MYLFYLILGILIIGEKLTVFRQILFIKSQDTCHNYSMEFSRKFLLLFFCWQSLLSCSKAIEPIGRLELFEMAKGYDESVKLVLADNLGGGPICDGREGEIPYGKGCEKIFVVKVGLLELKCVEFDTVRNAKEEAFRIKEYHFKNWVFDEVRGEVPLESFVKNAFGATLINNLR